MCLFGFSRGAYTARALAGMIHKVCLKVICLLSLNIITLESTIRSDFSLLVTNNKFLLHTKCTAMTRSEGGSKVWLL